MQKPTGGIELIKRTIIIISCCLWTFFLFGLWVILSQFKGMDGQWWSMYRMNPEKYGPWALEFSISKIVIFASLSIISAYFLTNFTERENI